MAHGFFLKGKDCARDYANFRGKRRWKEARNYANQLWALYEPLADAHFQKDARKHFLERYWEMYVAVALMANGRRPVRHGNSGPEFYFSFRGKRVWVEAIVPNSGVGPDQVRENDPADNFRVPVEKILLRYTAVLREKVSKLERDIARGIVSSSDSYVVAINGRAIPYAWAGGVLPYMIQAFLPIGSLSLTFDRRTKSIVDRSFERREAIPKQSGAVVSTMPFLDDRYRGVSVAIHSGVDAANLPRRLGADFFVLHNPLASNPLPMEVFAQWRQYVFRGNQLTYVPPSRRTSRRRMAPELRHVLRAPILKFE